MRRKYKDIMKPIRTKHKLLEHYNKKKKRKSIEKKTPQRWTQGW